MRQGSLPRHMTRCRLRSTQRNRLFSDCIMTFDHKAAERLDDANLCVMTGNSNSHDEFFLPNR